MTPVDLDALAAALRAAQPQLDDEDRVLVRTVYRALGRGRPVSDAEVAARAGQAIDRVSARLSSWPGVFRDDAGDIIGFWGLSIVEMGHRLEIDGRTLYTWCAWDPLFIAPLLGVDGRVTSSCAVTGTDVRLTVGPAGVKDLSPSGAVLSFLEPSGEWEDDVMETFCHYVLLFASPRAGARWVAEHPGTFLLTVDEAFALGRRARMFGV